MKKSILLFIIYIICALASCNGQTTQSLSKIEDTVKQMNLLDAQTKMFGDVFKLAGMSDNKNPTGGADNYLDMLNTLEASEELKKQIREMYHLYDASLDPTKKQELKIKVSKMLDEAIKKRKENKLQ